jgi:hypothetical protein
MMAKQARQIWESPFGRNEQLWMIDGARVIFDDKPGLVYQHGLIADDTVIIKKRGVVWLDLPVGERVSIELVSEDEGLVPTLDVLFDGTVVSHGSKSYVVQVPIYQRVQFQVRVSGAGATRLVSLSVNRLE